LDSYPAHHRSFVTFSREVTHAEEHHSAKEEDSSSQR